MPASPPMIRPWPIYPTPLIAIRPHFTGQSETPGFIWRWTNCDGRLITSKFNDTETPTFPLACDDAMFHCPIHDGTIAHRLPVNEND